MRGMKKLNKKYSREKRGEGRERERERGREGKGANG